MKTENLVCLKMFKSFMVMILIVILSVSLFSACSSAESSSKKGKSKKTKVKDSEDSEKEQEEETESTKKETEDSNTKESENSDPEESKDSNTKEKVSKESKESKEKNSKEPKEKESKERAETVNKAVFEALWDDLIKGNKRFMAGKHTSVNYSTSRVSLSKGQKPQVVVLGCADSRVPPEFIFDKNLGELFVIRDAGNIADAVSLGSIEYAVEHLHSKMIVVLGHESCGAVAAAVSGEKMPSKNLSAITESIIPAFENSKTCVIGEEPNLACVELNAEHSAKELLQKSSIIKKAVEEDEISIISAVYHFDTGEVLRVK